MKAPIDNPIAAIANMEGLCFNYDYFSSVMSQMRQFYHLSRCAEKSNLMLLYGPTGAGKTTIVKRFHQWVGKLEGDKLTTLYLSVPSSCTPKALASELLVALGDPLADKGTMSSMTQRVIEYARHKKISLIILDEFQHLIESKGEKVIYATADWFKSLMNELDCAFLLVGLPKLLTVIETNDQLERRVMCRASLGHLPLEGDKDLYRLQMLLSKFAENMPFKSASLIANEKSARTIHTATGGAIGRMVKVLMNAGVKAYSDGNDHLNRNYLEGAIKELFPPSKQTSLNQHQ